ncbi:hypothetical protein Mapa_009834 [Marchantia paleacea]|nr:hypothetical protein Mapa_009834 [Marchantia paleacea]
MDGRYGRKDLKGWCDHPGALCTWNIKQQVSDSFIQTSSITLDVSAFLLVDGTSYIRWSLDSCIFGAPLKFDYVPHGECAVNVPIKKFQLTRDVFSTSITDLRNVTSRTIIYYCF